MFYADINECTLGIHNCAENAECKNTDGSFTCICIDSVGDGTVCVGKEHQRSICLQGQEFRAC